MRPLLRSNDMEWQDERLSLTRRHFFSRSSVGIGSAALALLLKRDSLAAASVDRDPKTGGLDGLPHFPAKAKRIIYLHQSGAPSQIDLFDYKPQLSKHQGS